MWEKISFLTSEKEWRQMYQIIQLMKIIRYDRNVRDNKWYKILNRSTGCTRTMNMHGSLDIIS